MKTLMICPACKGKKKQVIQATLVTSKGNRKEPPVEIDCFTCKGKGEITKERLEILKAEANLWCKCGNPSEQTRYFADGEHPQCSKHCYTCADCGKIVQVG